MAKDRFSLTPVERQAYLRELDEEAWEKRQKAAEQQAAEDISRLKRLREFDPGKVKLAAVAQEQLNGLGDDERMMKVLREPNHPDYPRAMQIFRKLCEDATCHLSSDPAEAAWQQKLAPTKYELDPDLKDPRR